MEEREASDSEVATAERLMLTAFRKNLDELLAGRADPRPRADDDKSIFALADQAVKQYHAATARNPDLPRLSAVQCWEIRQRLYVSHSALGPLGQLLAVDGVEDIHINGTRSGYLEYGDRREPLPVTYSSEDDLIDIVKYYAEQGGKHFDPANPMVTVTLRDGSRLNAILPPVAKPLVITIRKQQLRRFLSLKDLEREDAIPAQAIPILDAAVRARLNAVICGPTGSGKTTMARILALLVPPGERTCVLETETELWLHELREEDFFSLEERDANVEGAGRVSLQDLFQRGALRQRPRRIIVGEVRGKEALDMLHAMTSGHDGSFTTLHASGPRAALNRLEVLAMSADPHLAPTVVRQMVAGAVDLIVHLGTYQRGDTACRRLGSLAFVAENPEDPFGGALLQEFCRYVPQSDDWQWESAALLHIPTKVRDKLELVGVEPAGLLFQTIGHA
ncbi:MAG: pilus assembly protein CpaF [Chloroflexota bacterium]|jgi:pilus assembly protein CpaF|nr:pilus assembly protein CpaF [Chloroflexota bacterium]